MGAEQYIDNVNKKKYNEYIKVGYNHSGRRKGP